MHHMYYIIINKSCSQSLQLFLAGAMMLSAFTQAVSGFKAQLQTTFWLRGKYYISQFMQPCISLTIFLPHLPEKNENREGMAENRHLTQQPAYVWVFVCGLDQAPLVLQYLISVYSLLNMCL